MVNQIRGFLESGILHITTLEYPPLQGLVAAALADLTGRRQVPDLYLIGRSVSVLASLCSIVVMYFLGRRWSKRTAWLAAIFLALSMGAAREAHWANPESLAAFWILLAIFCVFKLEDRDRTCWYILAGAGLALAIASKYLAALFLHLPILVLFLKKFTPVDSPTLVESSLPTETRRSWVNSRPILRGLGISYAAFSIIIFLALGLYVIRDRQLFIAAYHTHSPWAGAYGLYGTVPKPVPVPTYIRHIFPIALGFPIYISAVAGILLSLVTLNKRALVLLLCALPFYVFLEAIHYHPLRFCLTLLPILCLLAAFFFDYILGLRKMILRAIGRLTLTSLLLYSVLYTYTFLSVLDVQKDIRFSAHAWIERRVKDKSAIAMLGKDVVTNRIGWIQYEGMDRWFSETYNMESGLPEFVIVPRGFWENLTQYLRLTRVGYSYSADDWWPLAGAPSPNSLHFFEDVASEKSYKLVKIFKNGTRFSWVPFSIEPLKFDLWFTNLELLIYERKNAHQI